MAEFRLFLENITKLPEAAKYARIFFDRRFDGAVLMVYADELDESGRGVAADLFRKVGEKIRSPKLRTGPWQGPLIHAFYNTFGYVPFNWSAYEFNTDSLSNSWLICKHDEGISRMARHRVMPEHTSYRISLTNGKWSVYRNNTAGTVSVVSTRHRATPESERYYPSGRISLRDYKPVDVENVPDDIILFVFYRIIEKQVRGGH